VAEKMWFLRFWRVAFVCFGISFAAFPAPYPACWFTGTSGATTCSSLCLHPWNKKPPPVDDSDELLKNERLLLLRAQILSKKNSVRAYRSAPRSFGVN